MHVLIAITHRCTAPTCILDDTSREAGDTEHQALFMLIACLKRRYRKLAGMSRLLSLSTLPARHDRHLKIVLPILQRGALTSDYVTAASLTHSLKQLSSFRTSPGAAVQADHSILSYSSTETYTPQQLAELREDARDTIVALSSGSGRAGVAVIRVSGPRAGMSGSHCTWSFLQHIIISIPNLMTQETPVVCRWCTGEGSEARQSSPPA